MNAPSPIAIRRADAQDVEAVARLFRDVREACLPYLPRLHTKNEDLWLFRERQFRECVVWVAEDERLSALGEDRWREPDAFYEWLRSSQSLGEHNATNVGSGGTIPI